MNNLPIRNLEIYVGARQQGKTQGLQQILNNPNTVKPILFVGENHEMLDQLFSNKDRFENENLITATAERLETNNEVDLVGTRPQTMLLDEYLRYPQAAKETLYRFISSMSHMIDVYVTGTSDQLYDRSAVALVQKVKEGAINRDHLKWEENKFDRLVPNLLTEPQAKVQPLGDKLQAPSFERVKQLDYEDAMTELHGYLFK